MGNVAKTLQTITDRADMKTILNRGSAPAEVACVSRKVLSWWSYDLYSRKLGPATEGTELDLAALLSALVDRGAVIVLPTYKTSTPRTQKAGEHVISASQRHGKLTAVLSNQDTFKFSVRIFDANVITTDSVGKHRTFNITNEDGDWYDGWTDLQFIPTAKENDFLVDQFTEQASIAFKHFVAKGRWTSFFGQYYIIAKTLEQRLVEQNAYWRKAIKDMQEEGIRHPKQGSSTRDKGQSKTVSCFRAEVDVPFYGEFNKISETEELRVASRLLEKLRFLIRATEYAYWCKAYTLGVRDDIFPAWLQNVAWEDYKKPRSRTVWQRLKLSNDVALRMRVYDKKITVKA